LQVSRTGNPAVTRIGRRHARPDVVALGGARAATAQAYSGSSCESTYGRPKTSSAELATIISNVHICKQADRSPHQQELRPDPAELTDRRAVEPWIVRQPVERAGHPCEGDPMAQTAVRQARDQRALCGGGGQGYALIVRRPEEGLISPPRQLAGVGRHRPARG
jgi:hypothetical protein